MAASDEQAGDAPSGRHGGGQAIGGLSAAELIARARESADAVRPSSRRTRRHSAEPDEQTTPDDEARPGEQAPVQTTVPLTEILDLAPSAAAELSRPIQQRSRTVAPHEMPAAVAELPAAPMQESSRAGRDLPRAIAVGLTLGAAVLLTLFVYRPSFVVLVVAAIVIGVYEMTTAIATVEARAPLVPLAVGSVAMLAAAWFHGPDGLVGAFLLTVIGVAVWRLGDGAAGYLRDSASGAFIALYVPFLAGFAVLLAKPDDGAARIVLFIVAVVCSDTGGYATGVLMGKHPMAPTVSPKKSWEGFAGSVLACALAASLIMALTFHEQWWKGALFGLAIAVCATLGDLGESMIKRDIGIKDMGNLLPGHGGIMDRLDSLLPCAAVAYLLISAIVPV